MSGEILPKPIETLFSLESKESAINYRGTFPEHRVVFEIVNIVPEMIADGVANLLAIRI